MQDSQQQQQQHKHEQQQQEEEEEEEGEEEGTVEPRPFRRRGFRVGAGVCAARLRLHHLLQHWPHKVRSSAADGWSCFCQRARVIVWCHSTPTGALLVAAGLACGNLGHLRLHWLVIMITDPSKHNILMMMCCMLDPAGAAVKDVT
jgi:hypothetical protein